MKVILTALVLLVPITITPGLLFHYDMVPKVALLAITMACIGCRPVSMAEQISRLRRTDLGRHVCLLACVQTAWAIVATAVSARIAFSIFGSGWRRFGLITIFALTLLIVSATAHLLDEPESLKPILRAMALAAIGVSLYTILQYFNIDPFQSGAAYHAQDGDVTIVRPPGTLGHADYLGWWLAIALFCSWGLSRAEQGMWRFISMVAVSLSAIAIVFSGTRSAIAAGIGGMLFLVWSGRIRLTRSHYAAICGVALACIVFYVSPAGKMLQGRVKWSGDEAPGGARPLLWRDTLRMSFTRPLTGFGPETFAAEFPRFQSEELAKLIPDFYHESPHNVALDELASEGLPGLLVSIGWLALGFSAILRSRKGDAFDSALSAAFVASFIASLFNSMTIGPAVATAVILAALLARTARATEPEALRQRPPSAVVLRFAALPLAGLFTVFAILLIYSDYKMERFRRISTENKPFAAIEAYQGTRAMFAIGAGDDLYCSRRLAATCGAGSTAIERLQCTQFATEAAVRATTTADSPPNAWYNLAMFAAAYNDSRGAEKALRISIELAPNWFRPHWALGNYLRLAGRGQEAEAQIAKAALLSAGKYPQASVLRSASGLPQ